MITLSLNYIFHGPNPYSRESVIVADLAIGEETLADARTIIDSVRAITDKWYDKNVGVRHQGEPEELVGFILRWTFSALTYVQGYLNDCGYARMGPNHFRVWIGFHQPQISYSALELAVKQCADAADGAASAKDLAGRIDTLWNACRARHPDIHIQVSMEAARAKGIPYMPAWGVSRHWQFGWGAKSEVIFISATNADGFVSSQIVGNKKYSKVLLDTLGLPTPDDVPINSEADIPAALEKIGFPCVVKPVDQGGGKGISVGLSDIEQVRTAFKHARKYTHSPILLERYVPGSDHRLMVVGQRLVGVFRKDPPSLTGDGTRTIRKIVEEMNKDRMLPGVPSTRKHASIALDDTAIHHLAGQGVTPDTVLPSGRKITLRGNSNMKAGSSSTDVTADVHRDIRFAAEAIARTLNANMTGFDYVTTDISRSWREAPGAFIELNFTPGHVIAMLAGWSPNRIGELVLGTGPDTGPGRIPLDCIVLPDDGVALAEAHFGALAMDETTGWASHDKAQVGTLPLLVRARHSWSGPMTLLSHRTVERAFLLVGSRHMQRHGFPVDRADRIWCCDEDLPAEWLHVLQSVSSSPVRQGGWNACRDEVSVEPMAGPPPAAT